MDNVRPTDDPAAPGYWIGSGSSVLFDAALNQGAGGTVAYTDLLRISKGATLESSEECDCVATVTLEVDSGAATFEYYPSHPLDVVFVLDVTSSMMTGGSTKFVQAKRAIVSTINQMWAVNRDTTVTIVPYARTAFQPNASGTGLSYDYPGTLFAWKRSSGLPGYYIGQILGYRNQSNVSASALDAFEAQTVPRAASAQLSLYSYYNYYKIRYSDIYDAAGNPLPDTVLADYIVTVYSPAEPTYANNQIKAVAAGIPLTPTELTYSINPTGYAGNTILQNLVWAIPYGEDTNTEAGIQAAYQLFRTPGFAQSGDIRRRAAILITDGQANRSINPQYPDAVAAPGDTDAAFFPDAPGQAWKYFVQLQQTLPTLVSEISNRSSTFAEIALAADRQLGIAARLKDPADGNVSLFGLGINIEAQTPGPYDRQDVLELLESTVSAPSFFREANTSDPAAQIEALLETLVQDLFVLAAGCRVVLRDRINTALFSYIPGSIHISGVRNGLLLKSPNQPDVVDPSDPDFTVYLKAPLLPDVSDAAVLPDGSIALDLGVMPLGLLSPRSRTLVALTYRLQSNAFATGDRIHTNIDDLTYIEYAEPAHLQSAEPVIDYSAPAKTLHFHTPIVACHCTPVPGLSLVKFSDRSTAAPGETVTFTIEVVNTGTLGLVDILVDDPLLGLRFTIPSLEPLASFVRAYPYKIPPGTPPGIVTNVVTVSNAAVPESLKAVADVIVATSPSLQVVKTVDKKLALPGEAVVFTLTTANDGNVDLVNVHVTDPLLGIDTVIDRIPAGATVTADFPYLIPGSTPAGTLIVNTATTVVDGLPPLTVGVTVEVLPLPLLALEKLADRAETAPGTTVSFTLIAVNRGTATLTGVRVTDPTLGLDTTIGTIAPGQRVPIEVPFLIPLETPPKTYFNTATAVSDQTGPSEASAALKVLPVPLLGIAKIPSRQTASPGDTIQYELIVANPGNVPLGPIRLADALLGFDLFVPGLGVGESHAEIVSYVLPADAAIGSRIENVFVAESAEAGTAQAEAVVTVVGARLALAKRVEPGVALAGETVLYTLSVTNTTDAPQTQVALADPTLGFAETIPVLQPGETAVRTVPYTVPGVPEGTIIRNVFTAGSAQTPSQSVSAELIVYAMLTGTELRATKLATSTVAAPGGTIVYAVRVENIGGATASDIVVRDSLTGTQRRIPALAAGEQAIVEFIYAVPPNTLQGTIVDNRVLVTSPQANPVESEAQVIIALPHFALALTNVVNRPIAPPGTTVYFTVTVTNTSAFTLTHVRVFESLTGFSTTIPSLAPGESRAFVRPFVIPPESTGGEVFASIATAFSNETPFEQAPASVTTFTIADFTILETVDKPVVRGGETVFFTITVHNTGNVDLLNFRFAASLLNVVFRTERLPVGAVIRATFPFVAPETDEDIVIQSPVVGRADNAGPKHASASILVIAEDEE